MNGAALALGVEGWKPALAALALPPVPFIVLALAGAWAAARRRALGAGLVVLACAGLWFTSTTAVAEWLAQHLLQPPVALDLAQEAARAQGAGAREATAVVTLGGGRDRVAPEYGAPSLSPSSLERLRYGVWLSRRLGVPLAFTGGVGHGAAGGMAEAQIAARIAADEFGHPVRWVESASRDTRENAQFTMPVLAQAGVRRVILVTHGWHMPRALRAFREAADKAGAATPMEVVPAPMALAPRQEDPLLRWLPSSEGMLLLRQAWREWLGRLAGA